MPGPAKEPNEMNKEPRTAVVPPSEHDDGVSNRTLRALPYLGIILWYLLTKMFTVSSWSWVSEYAWILAFACVYLLYWGASVSFRHVRATDSRINGSSRFRSE